MKLLEVNDNYFLVMTEIISVLIEEMTNVHLITEYQVSIELKNGKIKYIGANSKEHAQSIFDGIRQGMSKL